MHQATTNRADSRNAARSMNATIPIDRSIGPLIAVTKIGSYKAAPSIPTTAALTPAIACADLTPFET